eukprot:gene19078-20995_t
MARIEWAMWANEQGVASALILFIGGVISVAASFKLWQIGAYACALSVLIFIFEYPRGKRGKGRTIERKGQYLFELIVSALGPLGRNYYVRFLVYLLACVPCVFILSTLLGALCLLITSIVYLRAAIANEKWLPCEREVVKDAGGKSIRRLRPPSMAPPRMKHASLGRENQAASTSEIGAENKV